MRAFVTGGGGFVGRHLGEHLASMGDEVTSVDLEVDVADPEAIAAAVGRARPEAIYHLAALSHVGASWGSPAEVLRVNVLGTAGVLGAARALSDPPVVLVISSAEVYGC
ncbi:MAG: GDP-mannose 4,6-dehydratase, partial [Acidimicrobiales bacterium]